MPLTAYVDESYRRRWGETACVYTLVAVVVSDESIDDIRDEFRGLRSGKNKTVHWRRESSERLSVIAAAVAAMPFTAVVAVHIHGPLMRGERARRRCLSPLLRHLHELGVDQIVFESRQAEDLKDMQVLSGWRLAQRPEAMIRSDFLPAVADPVLWLADSVAGAFMWWLGGTSDHWLQIEPKATVIEVDES